MREGLYYNPYFPGGAIGMAQALYNEVMYGVCFGFLLNLSSPFGFMDLFWLHCTPNTIASHEAFNYNAVNAVICDVIVAEIMDKFVLHHS